MESSRVHAVREAREEAKSGERCISGGVDRGPVGPGMVVLAQARKPSAPGVTKGKGKEKSTGSFDVPIVQAQGYTLITARQELGNKDRFQAGILMSLAG